jgi:hypothetical protein
VLWGRYDTSFTVAGGEAYHRDDPRAEVHILDAGSFRAGFEARRGYPANRGVHEGTIRAINCLAVHRIGEIEEVIDAVMYLNAATFVNGETLHLDGGAHAGRW